MVEWNVPTQITKVLLGIALAFASGFLFTTNNAIFKALNLNITAALLARYFIQSVVLLAALSALSFQRNQQYQTLNGKYPTWCVAEVDDGENIHKIRTFLVFQGIGDGLVAWLEIFSLTFMPLGDSTALVFTAPLSTMILSCIFLKTNLRLYKICCGLIIMTGVTLMVRPSIIFRNRETEQRMNQTTEPFILRDRDKEALSNVNETIFEEYVKYHKDYSYGAVAALAASITLGANDIMCARLFQNSTTASATLLGLYGGFGGILISLITLPFNFDEYVNFNLNVDLTDSLGLLLFSVIAVIGIVTSYKSSQYVSPTIKSFVRSADVIVAYLIQIIFLHEVSHYLSFIGAACIILAIILISVEDAIVNRLPMNVLKDIL